MQDDNLHRAWRSRFPHASEAHLEALIESTSDPIWSVDPEFRLVAFNAAFAKAFLKRTGVAAESGM